jgi:hypothetical protein
MKQATFKISENPEQQISQEKNNTEKDITEKDITEKDITEKDITEIVTKKSVLMTRKIPIKKVENIYYL